jgi:hypothetical protein
LPLLLGWSRKSTLASSPASRWRTLAASVAAALAAVQRRARAIVRVHDVAETVDALKVWRAADNSDSNFTTTPRPFLRSAGARNRDMSRTYFGTDGIRGTVGTAPITPDFMLRLGHAVGRVLRPRRAGPPC